VASQDVFPSSRDLFSLGGVAKRSSLPDRKFTYTISRRGWASRGSQPKIAIEHSSAVFKSLLVVQDLRLLDKLFAYSPLVGLAESTLSR